MKKNFFVLIINWLQALSHFLSKVVKYLIINIMNCFRQEATFGTLNQKDGIFGSFLHNWLNFSYFFTTFSSRFQRLFLVCDFRGNQ